MSKQFEYARQAAGILRPLLLPGAGPLKRRRKAEAEDHKQYAPLLGDLNVLGFSVGEKSTAGKGQTGVHCMTFYVRRKFATRRLDRELRIPKRMRIEAIGRSVVTDVVEMKEIPVAHAGAAQAGAMAGHFHGLVDGTIGMVVRDNATGAPMLLGCSHVFAMGGRARAGDAIESPPDPNGRIGPNRIGVLTNRFTVLDPRIFNTVDAALVALDAGVTVDAVIPGIGAPNGVLRIDIQNIAPHVGMRLARFGAGSGQLAGGVLQGVDASLPIRFPAMGDQTIFFSNAVLYSGDSKGGDSGAAVLEATSHSVVGIHIAGGGGLGVMTPIQPVLDLLGVTV